MGITSFAVKQVCLGPVKHAQILLQEIELLSAFCNNFSQPASTWIVEKQVWTWVVKRAFQQVLQQCCKTSYKSFVARFVSYQNERSLRHSTLGARDFTSAVSGFCEVFIVTAEDVSAFGQHRKSPPHARKTSVTSGSVIQIRSKICKWLKISGWRRKLIFLRCIKESQWQE